MAALRAAIFMLQIDSEDCKDRDQTSQWERRMIIQTGKIMGSDSRSWVTCATDVCQTLQKSGNTGCATLSFVPHNTCDTQRNRLGVGRRFGMTGESCFLGILLRL